MRLIQNRRQIARVVRELHEAPHKVVLYATGAGLGLFRVLWDQPGTSGTLLDGRTPYSRPALIETVGRVPAQFCSLDTACWMAAAAYQHGREYAIVDGDNHPKVIGLAITAAAATTEVKKGEHRVFVAAKTDDGMFTLEATMEKGLLSREQEGRVCDLLGLSMLQVLARDSMTEPAFIVPGNAGLTSKFLYRSNSESGNLCASPAKVQALAETVGDPYGGPVYWPDGTRGGYSDLKKDEIIIFPGSFKPWHHGHENCLTHAERMLNKKVICEMTGHHPDKGDVTAELVERLEQFRWRHPVMITRQASLYIDKAEMFPGVGLLVGVDAVKGILNPKYYMDSNDELFCVLERFSRLGTTFYVMGRTDRKTGMFETLSMIDVPNRFRHLFLEVSGRWDCASTDLR